MSGGGKGGKRDAGGAGCPAEAGQGDSPGWMFRAFSDFIVNPVVSYANRLSGNWGLECVTMNGFDPHLRTPPSRRLTRRGLTSLHYPNSARESPQAHVSGSPVGFSEAPQGWHSLPRRRRFHWLCPQVAFLIAPAANLSFWQSATTPNPTPIASEKPPPLWRLLRLLSPPVWKLSSTVRVRRCPRPPPSRRPGVPGPGACGADLDRPGRRTGLV